MTIRPAEKKDVPELLKLVKHLAEYEQLADQAKAKIADFERYGFGDEAVFNALLAEEEPSRRAVGFALYFFTYSTFTGKPTLYLEDLFVLPEFRGRGYGKKLLKKLAEIAVEKGCARMEWAVLDWNKPAIEFYLSLGAKPMEEWTTYRLSGEALSRLAGEG
ncbi:MAG: GNAT family N-acetyltransferase [Calditrichia bacterium]